jgi:hypothetical protein
VSFHGAKAKKRNYYVEGYPGAFPASAVLPLTIDYSMSSGSCFRAVIVTTYLFGVGRYNNRQKTVALVKEYGGVGPWIFLFI